MASNNYLHDISINATSAAYSEALFSPKLAFLLSNEALNVVRLYQSRVGKKTGRLMASAEANIRVGGHANDRNIAAVTIADENVVADWKGKPFYYGEFHEEGTLNSKRAKRRKSEARAPKPGYHELRQVAQEWRSI
jgi:hypothetical protein